MTSTSQVAGPPGPDLDLLEYVLVSAPSPSALAEVAGAVAGLVAAGAIRLLDVVVLVRPGDQAAVTVAEPSDHEELAALIGLSDGEVLLSGHDLELAAVTLAPEVTALLLLVEDRWAGALSSAARAAGGRLTGGERIARDRAMASLSHGPSRSGRGDLLARSPLCLPALAGSLPMVDQTAQVRQLARLVDQGLLSLEQYEVQRRRVLDC